VAADSRGIDRDTGVPNDNECKLAVFDYQLVFASVGNARRAGNSSLDPVPNWNNWEVAKAAFQRAREIPLEQGQLPIIATSWSDTIAANWKLFYHWP
jgi:hypothetical protein